MTVIKAISFPEERFQIGMSPLALELGIAYTILYIHLMTIELSV